MEPAEPPEPAEPIFFVIKLKKKMKIVIIKMSKSGLVLNNRERKNDKREITRNCKIQTNKH